jgi:CubicO group peptidase (beta-lactamase class C family)
MEGTRSEVRRLLGRAVASGIAPGLAAVWHRDGSPPQSVEIGHANLCPAPLAVGPDTWFDLASLTKPLVVTTLCLFAARRGDLDIASPIADVLPEARSREIGRATIHDLLCHSSGLPAWRPLYAMTDRPDEVLETILRIPLEYQPGSKVLYSCLDFILLGLTLERLAAEPLSVAFERQVLRPLDLAGELGYRPDPELHRVAAGALAPRVERVMTAEQGLDPARVPAPEAGAPDDGNARFLGGIAGNAGLFGTARGIDRLAREFLPGGGRLLRPDEAAAATTIATDAPGETRGLGWQLASTPGSSAGASLSPSSFGHTGFTGTSVWVDPERRMAMVLLVNRHHPGHRTLDLHPFRRRFHALVMEEGMRG